MERTPERTQESLEFQAWFNTQSRLMQITFIFLDSSFSTFIYNTCQFPHFHLLQPTSPSLHSICTNSLVPQMWHAFSCLHSFCRCYSLPRMTFILFWPDQPKFTFFQMNAIKIYGIPTMLPFLQVLLELFCGSYCQSY